MATPWAGPDPTQAPDVVETDVLVIGSGAGGLVTAITAGAAGRRVLVVEKLATVGGSTSLSGGALWVPMNPLMAAEGRADSFDDAWTYLDGLVGDQGQATSEARKLAYLTTGPQLVEFLMAQGVRLISCRGYPDYYASRPGGRADGRAVESAVVDGRQLGVDRRDLNQRPILPALALRSQDLPGLSNGIRTGAAVRSTVSIGARTVAAWLRRRAPLSMGNGLVAQLLQVARGHQVALWRSTELVELVVENGAVTGAVLQHDGRRIQVTARHGLVVASGGFAHNVDMRRTHQADGAGARWTSAAPGDLGDGIRAAANAGAALDLMDEAWWMSSSLPPDGVPRMHLLERSKPHSLIVDSTGRRFVNECVSYMEFGQAMLRRRAEEGPELRFWLLLDGRNRRRCPFGLLPPGYTPRRATGGYLHRSGTLRSLAVSCGIDPAGLVCTVEHFNNLCAAGRDTDFGRGEDPYDRYYGDPSVSPNPCLGPLARAPFFAVELFCGDIGTCGGILTDDHARVLRPDLTPIPRLYATGNCTASVMGRAYPGPGATIGPAAVFGYRAARHLTDAGVAPDVGLSPGLRSGGART